MAGQTHDDRRTMVQRAHDLGLRPLLALLHGRTDAPFHACRVGPDGAVEVQLHLDLAGAEYVGLWLATRPAVWFFSGSPFPAGVLQHTPPSRVERTTTRTAIEQLRWLLVCDGLTRAVVSEGWTGSAIAGGAFPQQGEAGHA